MATLYLENGLFELRAAVKGSDSVVALWSLPMLDNVLFPGALCQGKIMVIDKQAGGAFVDIGAGQNAFMNITDRVELTQGQAVVVALKRLPEAGKGALVTLSDKRPSQRSGDALIDFLRWVMERHDVSEIATPEDDHFLIRKKLAAFSKKEIPVSRVETEGSDLQTLFDEALAHKVQLPDGASLVFDETEALTAIDFNIGRAGGQSKRGAVKKSVLAAVPVLMAQIKQRGIGGQVVIDLPGACWPAREDILAAINPRLPEAGRVGPFLKNGLVVMSLPKTAPSLLEQMTCPAAGEVRKGCDYRVYVRAEQVVRAIKQERRHNRLGRLSLQLEPQLLSFMEGHPQWEQQVSEWRLDLASLKSAAQTGWKLEIKS